MTDEKKPEEKKPNPILNELDKEAAGQTPAPPAAQPAEAAAAAVPPPAAEAPAEKSEPPPAEVPPPPPPVAEPVAEPTEESPQELVSDAMRRLDDILKKIKDKKADPAP